MRRGWTDRLRARLLAGQARVAGRAEALDLVASAIVENIGAVSRNHAAQIESFEDALLYRPEAFDHRRLIDIRRRVAQFHRLLSGMRTAFRRLEQDRDCLPSCWRPSRISPSSSPRSITT